MPPQDYIEIVNSEIRQRSQIVPFKEVDTIYFGGGTPSLIPAELIVSVINEIAKSGFKIKPHAEITLEINPATVDPKKLDIYLKNGINRFSVGAQSFNDRLLQRCGREHSANDTRLTLKLLQEHKVNYSFDLLFALPDQSLDDLQKDLEEVHQFLPRHLSAYCLTLPEGHSMQVGRPNDVHQVRMFEMIESSLAQDNLHKYEISNFAQANYESQHNMLYWSNENYWGVGLSAHSYFKIFDWGLRFWNPKSMQEYQQQVEAFPSRFARHNDDQSHAWERFFPQQKERLAQHESLTDFCHTALRLARGLNLDALRCIYGDDITKDVQRRLNPLIAADLVQQVQSRAWLTPQGELLSNRVFYALTFTAEELLRIDMAK